MIRAGAENTVATPLASTRSAISGDAITFSTKFTMWVKLQRFSLKFCRIVPLSCHTCSNAFLALFHFRPDVSNDFAIDIEVYCLVSFCYFRQMQILFEEDSDFDLGYYSNPGYFFRCRSVSWTLTRGRSPASQRCDLIKYSVTNCTIQFINIWTGDSLLFPSSFYLNTVQLLCIRICI